MRWNKLSLFYDRWREGPSHLSQWLFACPGARASTLIRPSLLVRLQVGSVQLNFLAADGAAALACLYLLAG